MTIEEKVYALLSAMPTVTALCPASRIKVPGNWQGLVRPYVVHHPVTVEPIRTHDGLESLRIWEYYQISVIAETYSSGTALAVAIRDGLDGIHDGCHFQWRPGGWYVGRDDDMNIEHFALNFRVAEAL